jgi:K+-sensing histidine kinase KdpD
MSILPQLFVVGDVELKHGSLIQAPEFCVNSISVAGKENKKCKDYYRHLMENGNRISICPYGFNSYILRNEFGQVESIFSCFRLHNKYDKKTNKYLQKNERNIVISDTELEKFLEAHKEFEEALRLKEIYYEYLIGITHDIRKYNSDIKSSSDEINRRTENPTKKKSEDTITDINNYAKDIWAWSSFISTRLESINYIDQGLVECNTSFLSCNFFKTFDKLRKCMNHKRNTKHINIESNKLCDSIRGRTNIDNIAAILIENAHKYSLENSIIDVNIDDTKEYQKITVSNIGPRLYENEIASIRQRNKRGSNAEKVAKGTGIGLYTVDQICKENGFQMNINSDNVVQQRHANIDYTKFEIEIVMPKKIR